MALTGELRYQNQKYVGRLDRSRSPDLPPHRLGLFDDHGGVSDDWIPRTAGKDRHGAGLAARHAALPCAATMIGGHDAHEHQEYLRDQRLVRSRRMRNQRGNDSVHCR